MDEEIKKAQAMLSSSVNSVDTFSAGEGLKDPSDDGRLIVDFALCFSDRQTSTVGEGLALPHFTFCIVHFAFRVVASNPKAAHIPSPLP